MTRCQAALPGAGPFRGADLDQPRALLHELDLRRLDATDIGAGALETEVIPDGATVVDLRTKPAYDSWHFPGALFFDYGQALKAYGSFKRDIPYEVMHVIAVHSKEGDHVRRSPEAIIFHHADFTDFDLVR